MLPEVLLLLASSSESRKSSQRAHSTLMSYLLSDILFIPPNMCRFMRIYTQSYRILLRFLSQSSFQSQVTHGTSENLIEPISFLFCGISLVHWITVSWCGGGGWIVGTVRRIHPPKYELQLESRCNLNSTSARDDWTSGNVRGCSTSTHSIQNQIRNCRQWIQAKFTSSLCYMAPI